MQKVKLQKVGNSYMITLPKKIKEEIGLKLGDVLSIRRNGNHVEYFPVKKKKSIADTVGRFSVENFDFEQSMKDIKEGAYKHK